LYLGIEEINKIDINKKEKNNEEMNFVVQLNGLNEDEI